jgi:tRNA threonylcarbamoyladenosine biosynthesis protein TsaB
VVGCLDARMGEIYLAAYARSGEDWHAVHDATLCAPEHAPPLPAGMWVACGGGFSVHGAALGKRYAGRLSEVRAAVYPHARQIAALGARRFELGKGVPAEEALPVYLRDKVALRTDERPN